MAYNKTTWEDLPSTNTPLSAANLNKIENELEKLSDKNIITVTVSANQSIPHNGVTRVNLDTVSSSIGTDFTLSQSPSRIVCGKTGKIKINAFVTLADLVANGNTQIRVFQNSNIIINNSTRVANTSNQGFAIPSKLVNVAQNDEIAISVGNWSGSANTVVGTDSYTYLTLEYLE